MDDEHFEVDAIAALGELVSASVVLPRELRTFGEHVYVRCRDTGLMTVSSMESCLDDFRAAMAVLDRQHEA